MEMPICLFSERSEDAIDFTKMRVDAYIIIPHLGNNFLGYLHPPTHDGQNILVCEL